MVEQEETPFENVSLGDQLRLAREAKGMSLDDIASRTRIPIRHLQHIESEDWEALPAVTYAIGFTRNYANAVGLDGAGIAGELRERIGGPRNRAPATQYYEQADPARVPPRSLAIIAAILAVVLALGYFLWWSTREEAPAEVPILEVGAPPAPAAAAPAPVTPQAAAGQAVTLTATGDVWLRISDGEAGPALFSGSLAAGQSFAVPASAQRPLLRTGRPQLLRAAVGASDLGPIEPVERTVDNLSLLPQDLAARPPSPAPSAPALAPPPSAPPSAPLPD